MLFFAFCFISCATIFKDSPLKFLKEAYNHKKQKKNHGVYERWERNN